MGVSTSIAMTLGQVHSIVTSEVAEALVGNASMHRESSMVLQEGILTWVTKGLSGIRSRM